MKLKSELEMAQQSVSGHDTQFLCDKVHLLEKKKVKEWGKRIG